MKIRENYWKFYNILYVGAQEAVIAFRPLIEYLDNHRNNPPIEKYMNHEMYAFI
jgi:hypothetical protein